MGGAASLPPNSPSLLRQRCKGLQKPLQRRDYEVQLPSRWSRCGERNAIGWGGWKLHSPSRGQGRRLTASGSPSTMLPLLPPPLPPSPPRKQLQPCEPLEKRVTSSLPGNSGAGTQAPPPLRPARRDLQRARPGHAGVACALGCGRWGFAIRSRGQH